MQIISRIYLVAGCAIAALSAATPASAECTRAPLKMSLPAQRMDERLQTIAKASGCFIEVDTTILNRKRARSMRGRYDIDRMLMESLQNTDLVFQWEGDHFLVSERED